MTAAVLLAGPLGAACDLGAVERDLAGDVNVDAEVNAAGVLSLINFLFASGPPPAKKLSRRAAVLPIIRARRARS